ncbi:MAG TPA: helix-turn-helix domain-containing protein [Hyphomicrobiaceae bacterium]|jgi:AraC-like DNA-binding protein
MQPTDVDIVPAPEHLRPFVRRYMYANRRLESELAVRPKPTGYTYFANCFGDLPAYHVVVDGQAFPQSSRWHLPGQIVDHDIVVHHPDRHQMLYCELSATGLYRLFGVPGERTAGRAPPLPEIGAEFDALARRHFVRGPDDTREEHIAEADAFFTALAERAGSGEPLVEAAVALFEAGDGGLRVGDICERLNADPRHLNRRFNQIVGVGPKFFGQVLQINWVVGLLYANDAAKLSDIAQAAGFHDQSHFHRAMRRFFNEGPREFLASDHVLFKTFLGASRRFGPASPATE